MKNPDLATAFHALHRGPEPLILANAWDAGSARLIESLGARAIATTSAGVAWVHGYPDGDALPEPQLLATAQAIARVIRVPLSMDIEAGYSDDPDAVGRLAAALIEAGVVGINLEDGAGTPELLCAKIARIRRVARELGVDLYINARTDVYLRGLSPEADRVAETCAGGALSRGRSERHLRAEARRAAGDRPGRGRRRPAAQPPGIAGPAAGARAGAAGRAAPQRRIGDRPGGARPHQGAGHRIPARRPQRVPRGRGDPPRHEHAD